jgi:3-methyl-2-oxobutanoate hydroxymethyltransferase
MTDVHQREAIALPELAAMKRAGTKIVMVTAYDHPSARLASEAGVDLILVGDSAGNNVLGYESTVPVSMDEAVMLTAAVARAKPRALVIGDMPFGSFQASDASAVANAVRLVKAGADAVKLEGAGPMLSRARAIVGAGIPVMGHLGLTPQSATKLGGMKAQGRTAATASQLLADAHGLEAAGCFALVLESVPARVAAHVSEAIGIPTIGIGAGPGCDGQVLVWHDLLGLTEGPTPRFVKRYADLAGEIRRGLHAFAADVRSGAYPADEHVYKIPADELHAFEDELRRERPA